MALTSSSTSTAASARRAVFYFFLAIACGPGASSRAADDVAVVSLGKQLFFDKKISADNTVACSSCHDPAKSYADGRPTAAGIRSQLGTRNTPTLLNASGNRSLFWDGRRSSLEDLVLDPIKNPVEMGLTDDSQLLRRLRADPTMIAAFTAAFPGASPITSDHVRQALAGFVRSLPTQGSAYDRFRQDPARFPISEHAAKGLLLFRGKGGCSQCHRLDYFPERFTDDSYHHSSVGWQAIEHKLPELTREVLRANLSQDQIGVRSTTDSQWAALGRFVVTHNPSDIGAFRTPSLRNVAATAPYMHDGSVQTLEEAIDIEIYYRSLETAKPLNITVTERTDLIAFLHTLTDESAAH